MHTPILEAYIKQLFSEYNVTFLIIFKMIGVNVIFSECNSDHMCSSSY